MSNFSEKGTEIAIMIITMPGADCAGVGYRIAVLERFIFGIKYAAPKAGRKIKNPAPIEGQVARRPSHALVRHRECTARES